MYPMNSSVTRLIFLVCTLDAATFLAASMPFYASSDMSTRNADSEVLYVHPRSIIAREPKSADFSATAVDIEERDKIGTAVEVLQMIGDVVTQIKQSIAADKDVRFHLFVVQSTDHGPSPNTKDNLNLNRTVATGRNSWWAKCMTGILLGTTSSAIQNIRTSLMVFRVKIGITATRSFRWDSWGRPLGKCILMFIYTLRLT